MHATTPTRDHHRPPKRLPRAPASTREALASHEPIVAVDLGRTTLRRGLLLPFPFPTNNRYKKTYKYAIAAMSEKAHWQRSKEPKVCPPDVVRQGGRPQVVRKRSKDEGWPSTSSSKVQRIHKCKKCGRLGQKR